MIKCITWSDKYLRIIDQTEIPHRQVYRNLYTIDEVYEAIQKLRVRGAPAIGVAAAYGLYLAVQGRQFSDRDGFLDEIRKSADYLASARPTAVNLKWALESVISEIELSEVEPSKLPLAILALAKEIQRDDEIRCEKIGEAGAPLIADGMTILTHCNTGALATAGIGTAFGVIHTAFRQGKSICVLADETRPLLQGARLTMWELKQAGIPAKLITDGMAAAAMSTRKVDMVIVGADRIAANGDTANKIGTYSLAVNSHFHKIPFYVAAPLSTFDFSIATGEQIPIEERGCEEITDIWGQLPVTIRDAECWNPAFDVTPAELITGIITEAGVLRQPLEPSITEIKSKRKNHQNHKELIS